MQCNVLRDDEKIDALYGEATPEALTRIREHLRACPACREELKGFEATRARLATWTAPDAARPVMDRRPSWTTLKVAAALLLALGGILVYRGTEVRFESGRVSVRFGVRDEQTLRALAEQDARHTREIAVLKAALQSAPAEREAPLTLADVQRLIRESEARQGESFLARLDALRDRTDAQRRIDMARVSAGLSYLDGKNGQQLARTGELMNSMLQASYTR